MSETPAPHPGADDYKALAESANEALRLIERVTTGLRAAEGRRPRLLSFIAATVEFHVGELARELREASVTDERCCHPRIGLIAERTDEPGAWEGLCANCGSSVVVAVTTEISVPTRQITVADLDALDGPEGNRGGDAPTKEER